MYCLQQQPRPTPKPGLGTRWGFHPICWLKVQRARCKTCPYPPDDWVQRYSAPSLAVTSPPSVPCRCVARRLVCISDRERTATSASSASWSPHTPSAASTRGEWSLQSAGWASGGASRQVGQTMPAHQEVALLARAPPGRCRRPVLALSTPQCLGRTSEGGPATSNTQTCAPPPIHCPPPLQGDSPAQGTPHTCKAGQAGHPTAAPALQPTEVPSRCQLPSP